MAEDDRALRKKEKKASMHLDLLWLTKLTPVNISSKRQTMEIGSPALPKSLSMTRTR